MTFGCVFSNGGESPIGSPPVQVSLEGAEIVESGRGLLDTWTAGVDDEHGPDFDHLMAMDRAKLRTIS